MSTYEQDFYEWTQKTARSIKAGCFQAIDREALADEVESLGKRDRREVVSRLAVILMHLLKDKYQPEKRTHSWMQSVREQRNELALVLRDSPSLRAQVPALLADAYERARLEAAIETGLEPDTFPNVCEWPVGEIID